MKTIKFLFVFFSFVMLTTASSCPEQECKTCSYTAGGEKQFREICDAVAEDEFLSDYAGFNPSCP